MFHQNNSQGLPNTSDSQVLAAWLESDSHFVINPSVIPTSASRAAPSLAQASSLHANTPQAVRAAGPTRNVSTQTLNQGEAQEEAQQQQQQQVAAQPVPNPTRQAAGQPQDGHQHPSRHHHRHHRSRAQVARDSVQLLWREYLALNDRPPTPHTDHNSDSIMGGASDSATTLVGGTFDYDKPKGIPAKVIKYLCLPSDALDFHVLSKAIGAAFVVFSRLVLTLAFVALPAWLWLVRFEYQKGHVGHALMVAAGGLLLWLVCDAATGAVTRAAAEKKQGLFSASSGAYQTVPPARYAGGVGTHPPIPAAQQPQHAAHQPQLQQREAALGAAAANRAVHAQADAAVEAQVHVIKKRIIRLEGVLFGNELREGDVARDQLHTRVQTLCNEVGIAYPVHLHGTHKLTLADLERLLDDVIQAVGLPPQP